MPRHDLYDDLAKIKAAIAHTAYDVKDNTVHALSDSVNTARKESNKLKKGLIRYAHKKPLKLLGISFATGMWLGFLIKRRR